MTKVISIFIVVALLWGGWGLYKYWVNVKDDDDASKLQQTIQVNGLSLPGLPSQLYDSFNAAKQGGTKTMGAWLDQYDSQLDDPRRAWIELDYAVAITRDNPHEAKKIYDQVKGRIKENSPVYTRVKQLESTYD